MEITLSKLDWEEYKDINFERFNILDSFVKDCFIINNDVTKILVCSRWQAANFCGNLPHEASMHSLDLINVVTGENEWIEGYVSAPYSELKSRDNEEWCMDCIKKGVVK